MQGLDELPGKGKKHVGLSLCVRRLHAGLTAASLEEVMGLTACVASVEDHGYILSLGIKVCTTLIHAFCRAASRLGVCGLEVQREVETESEKLIRTCCRIFMVSRQPAIMLSEQAQRSCPPSHPATP